MSTFLQMQNRIADDLDRTDLTTQIQKAINRAIEYYEKQRFWFNETTGTFSTVASQQAYSSSDASFIANIAAIDVVRLTYSSSNYIILEPRTYNWVQEMDTGSHTTTPSDYAFYKQNIYLYPTPNAAWTVTVSYQKKYTELSADADTNDWTTEAEDLIEARTRWWIYKRIIKDKEMADEAKSEETEALICLRDKTTNLISTSRIRTTEW